MFKLINLPIEIKNIILEYYFSNLFNKKFKECLKNITLESIFFKIKYINKKNLENNFNDYLDTILEYTNSDERLLMIKKLNQCNCCNIHKLNKPTSKQYLDGYVPEYSTSIYRNKKCKCQCRQFCRSICRAENDEIIEI